MTQKHTRTPAFAHSTVIPSAAENYLYDELPRYRECGLAMGVSARARLLLTRTDYVEFWVRRYIGGRDKTLHSANYEIRSFLALDDWGARRMIAFSLDALQQTILENEWYECMPRYLTARRRIQRQFAIQDIEAYR
jgi:hypothetical protein